MLELLIGIGVFLFVFFFLGLCIFVHELGHLLVALWRRMHVEKFSVGFGRRLWGFTRNGVEYVVSALPFGGYVALPQLDPTEEPVDRNGAPLPQASPGDRLLTALAGPLANILFGFLLATVVWLVGVERPAPTEDYEVHTVPPASPEYAAGLRPGDRVLEVNGNRVPGGWSKLAERIALTPGKVMLSVQRGEDQLDITYIPAPNPDYEGLGFPMFEALTPVMIEHVKADYPAERAGLEVGDRFLSVDGEPVANAYAFMEMVWSSEGRPLTIEYEREGRRLSVFGIQAVPEVSEGKSYHIIGVRVGEPTVLVHLTPWAQFVNVLQTTGRTINSLFRRDSLVKARHMSGPVGIVQMNYLMIRHSGLRQGLFFVVFVCFSLALINLLPIPVLDGGHILFALIETVIRRRVPCRLAYILQMVFAVLLISFMLYVTFFDVRRVGKTFFRSSEATEAPAIEPASEDRSPDHAE